FGQSLGLACTRLTLRAQIGIVRLKVGGWWTRHPCALRGRGLHADSFGNFSAHLLLDGKNIGNAAIEPIGPEIVAGGYIDELRVETDLIACPPHAAIDDKAHAKLTADIRQNDGLPLVG